MKFYSSPQFYSWPLSTFFTPFSLVHISNRISVHSSCFCSAGICDKVNTSLEQNFYHLLSFIPGQGPLAGFESTGRRRIVDRREQVENRDSWTVLWFIIFRSTMRSLWSILLAMHCPINCLAVHHLLVYSDGQPAKILTFQYKSIVHYNHPVKPFHKSIVVAFVWVHAVKAIEAKNRI